jgi:hypothetical protein
MFDPHHAKALLLGCIFDARGEDQVGDKANHDG